MTVSKRKPKVRTTTIKALADWGNKTLKPESEERYYEFGNGAKEKKAGKGPYEN